MNPENEPQIADKGEEQITVKSKEYKYSENEYHVRWRSYVGKGSTMTQALASLILDIRGD